MTTGTTAPADTADAGGAGRAGDFWDGIAHAYVPPAALSIDPRLTLHADAADEVDPITYEVIRYTLLNTNFEHTNLIRRLCVSPVTMISLDFQSSVLLEDGDLVFLGPNLQYFSNSHSHTIKWILEHRSASPGIGADDMFLSNDPYIGAPHQPDVCVSAPVFVDGKLFCWVANVMNHSDVGGTAPGSFCLAATDAWSDPPMFPPVKLVDGGELRDDVEQLFVRQSRMPAAARMDLRAAVAGNTFAKRRVLDLVERYGADVVKAVMRRVIDAGERLFADRLAAIPDGTWSHRAYTEVALPGDRGVYAFQVNVHKRGDRLKVDNAGTDPQAGSLSAPYVAFVGAVLCALTQQLTSDLAGAYGGVYRRVDFDPRPGLLNCPDHPAAVSPAGAYSTEMCINAASIAIGKMMACGGDRLRELILGPVVPHPYGVIYAGLDADGELFIMINSNGLTGAGAGRPDQDGIDAGGQYWVPEAIAYNVEHVEAQYPVLYLYRRMLEGGAGGAGRHRGGPGFVECTLPWGAQGLEIQLYSNESFAKGLGLAGGNPNSRAWLRLRQGTDVRRLLAEGRIPGDLDQLTGREAPVSFKGAPLGVGPDDVFEWSFPANAGFGDPLRRDPAAVLADVTSGHITAATAERVYGVRVAAGAVDEFATEALRTRAYSDRVGRPAAPRPGSPAGLSPIADALGVAGGRICCACCGADLCAAGGNYKDAAVRREHPMPELAPEFAGDDVEMAGQMVFREFCCPACGVRFDTEIARAGDPPLWDVRLTLP
jgi:N-methylhydantoinase B